MGAGIRNSGANATAPLTPGSPSHRHWSVLLPFMEGHQESIYGKMKKKKTVSERGWGCGSDGNGQIWDLSRIQFIKKKLDLFANKL